jgi:hypothetical protein
MPLSAPVITNVTVDSYSVTIFFTSSVGSGGSGVTNYQYTIDNGSTWNIVSMSQTTSPITITGLTDGETYRIMIRAIDENQDPVEVSPSSNKIDAIPNPFRCCINIEANVETYLKYAEAMGLTQSAVVPTIPVVV